LSSSNTIFFTLSFHKEKDFITVFDSSEIDDITILRSFFIFLVEGVSNCSLKVMKELYIGLFFELNQSLLKLSNHFKTESQFFKLTH
jgi:hypothetical protein